MEKKEYKTEKYASSKVPKAYFGDFEFFVNTLISILYKNLLYKKFFYRLFISFSIFFRHKRGSDIMKLENS
jgi:hypothetical protein